jgi:protein TonB
MAGNRLPANGPETSCLYYYNRPLKKNVYTTVEIEPEFPGGAAGYVRFLNKNLWISEDTVDDVTLLPIPRMKFIVDTDGQIINPSIQGENDTTNLNSLERATLQFIKKMPKWVPGMCNGKVVATEVVRPLAICLKWETD